MQVTIDTAAVRRVFTEFPEQSVRTMNKLIEGAAVDTQREMRRQVNVGATGELRRDIKYKMTGRLSAEIGPTLARGRFLEEGTKPRWVSVKPGTPLRRWADHKGINPYAVQRAIAKRGTKAHPFIRPTYRKMAPRVQRDVVSGFNKFIKEVDSGRI